MWKQSPTVPKGASRSQRRRSGRTEADGLAGAHVELHRSARFQLMLGQGQGATGIWRSSRQVVVLDGSIRCNELLAGCAWHVVHVSVSRHGRDGALGSRAGAAAAVLLFVVAAACTTSPQQAGRPANADVVCDGHGCISVGGLARGIDAVLRDEVVGYVALVGRGPRVWASGRPGPPRIRRRWRWAPTSRSTRPALARCSPRSRCCRSWPAPPVDRRQDRAVPTGGLGERPRHRHRHVPGVAHPPGRIPVRQRRGVHRRPRRPEAGPGRHPTGRQTGGRIQQHRLQHLPGCAASARRHGRCSPEAHPGR